MPCSNAYLDSVRHAVFKDLEFGLHSSAITSVRVVRGLRSARRFSVVVDVIGLVVGCVVEWSAV